MLKIRPAVTIKREPNVFGYKVNGLSMGIVLLYSALIANPAGAQAIITVPTAPPIASTPTSTVESTQSSAEEGKITKTSAERQGKTATEIFLGVYLTLDKECKIGAAPKLEFPTPPQNGKIHTRNFPINLRDVPGAPRRTCIGTSPSGMAVIYRSDRKFKGEENVVFRLTYPNKEVREATVKIIVQ